MDRLLGDDVGRIYARRFFSPRTRTAANAVVADVKAALRPRLEANTWLSASSKATDVDQLDRLEVMIG